MKPKVIGLGEVLWDMLPEGRQLGGAPANFAYHAGRQGADATVVSRVGKDSDGTDIRNLLNGKQLSAHLQEDPEYPTGTVSVDIKGEGIPEYIIHQPVAWDFLEFTSELQQLANESDAVCYGSLAQRNEQSAAAIRSFVEATSPKTLRIFDINLRQEFYSKELIDANLQLANVIKFNEEEFGTLRSMYALPSDELLFIREIIARFNLSHVVYTKGSEGSYLADHNFTSYLATPDVPIVDTIGAGDSFTATVAMGILDENRISEIHAKAIKIGAFVCGQKGAMPEYQ